ncbi:MAG: LamG domain-containing protein [bacterium]|nr:LamG domain-containing protein [bacterium]
MTPLATQGLFVVYEPSVDSVDGYRVYFTEITYPGRVTMIDVGLPIASSVLGELLWFDADPAIYKVEMSAYISFSGGLVESARSNARWVLVPFEIATPEAETPPEDPTPPIEDPAPASTSNIPSSDGDPRLLHWWNFGASPDDPGRDFGNSSNVVNLDALAIDAADIQYTVDGSYATLDGDGQRFENRTQLQLGIADEWTLSLWLRPDSALQSAHLFQARGAYRPEADEISLRINGGISPASIGIDGWDSNGELALSYEFPSPFSSGRWSHAVVRYDGSRVRFDVDGESFAPTAESVVSYRSLSSGPRFTAVGAAVGGANGFSGALHSFSIWNTALADSEVDQLFQGGMGFELNSTPLVSSGQADSSIEQPDSGGTAVIELPAPSESESDPVPQRLHWWRMGFESDDPGRDFGDAAQLISLDSPDDPIDSADVHTTAGGAYADFDGVRERLVSEPKRQIGIADRWALSAWFRPDDLSKEMRVFTIRAEQDQPQDSIELGVRGAEPDAPIRVLARGGSGATIDDLVFPGALAPGRWVHVFAQYEAGRFVVFIDGESTDPAPGPVRFPVGPMSASPRSVSIGGDLGGTQEFNGSIHSVSLWDEWLSEDQIRDLHARGRQALELTP